MVLGAVLLVLGTVLGLRARAVGAALNNLHAEQVKHSSLLSEDQIDRRRRIYQSPQNQTLEAWIVRVFGLLVAVGGAGSMIHSLTR